MTGRHRAPRGTRAPVALGLSVFALLSAFGVGAALLPASFTGPGRPVEQPGATVAASVPGTGGGVPGATASPTRSVAATPWLSATPSRTPAKAASPSRSATRKAPARRTTTATPKPAAPKVRSGQEAQENEVIRLTNVERDKAGCRAVEPDTRLRTAMRLHVQELGTHGDLYISHVSDDGRSFVDRAQEQGYDDPGGENVARGQRDAAEVMESWMASEGHRADILNCSFKAIGVGVVKGVDGTLVWGQIFGRP